MKMAKYWRKANATGQLDAAGKVDPSATVLHKSINAAKRWSREMQKGVLGQGSLIVVR